MQSELEKKELELKRQVLAELEWEPEGGRRAHRSHRKRRGRDADRYRPHVRGEAERGAGREDG